MNFKICSKCKLEKTTQDFYLRKTGFRRGKYYEKCKECMKLRGRSYYHLNRIRQLRLANLRRNKYRLMMRTYINKVKNVPCVDCKQRYPPCVMDFDHKNKGNKKVDVGRMINGGWSKEKVDKEIQKCEIVCANCHRIRTYKTS